MGGGGQCRVGWVMEGSCLGLSHGPWGGVRGAGSGSRGLWDSARSVAHAQSAGSKTKGGVSQPPV